MVRIARALVSCHDKTGLEVFANGLARLGVELVASSGTAAFLRQHGVTTTTVEEFAGISEQLDGRVKTLHPRIHAGILAKRDDPAHMDAVGQKGLIDLVVVNLYPFQEAIQQAGVTLHDALEQIDIGGVALLRAAAKNFPFVAVASHPQQYPTILSALEQGKGALSESFSRELATAAFHLTSRYDQGIAAFVTSTSKPAGPADLVVSVRQHATLRYGENPHQQAAWYVPSSGPVEGLARLVQLQGKELSYNNLLDIDTTVRCLLEFAQPTCVIVKHASPCGIASASTIAEAYQRAVAGDLESAFGSIVGINRPLDPYTAAQMTSTFLEVIVAPAIEPTAKAAFAKKSKVRLIALEPLVPTPSSTDWRSVLGGWLVQDLDVTTLKAATAKPVTERHPDEAEQRDLTFAWLTAKHVKSNAIVLAKDAATIGIGQGQPSRVRAVRLAIQNAGDRCRGAVLASDGFFPFPDSIELAAQAGIRAIIQPGGSVKDSEVIAAADRAGLAMVFAGVRHFRH